MSPRRRRSGTRRRVSVAGSVTRFTLAGLLVTAALIGVTGVLAQRAGEQEATRSAERIARVVAGGVVEPLLTPEVAAGEPRAVAALDEAVRRVLESGPVVRVKVWAADGRLVWSDEPRLVGRSFPLDDEERAVLSGDVVISHVSDLTEPENRYERGHGALLEAYVGVRDTAGRPLVVEVYQSYDGVAEAAAQAWRRFAPAGLGALLVLELLQIPLAWGLARRLRRSQEGEASLLQAAVDASQAERRRIAHDVHDGVVQDLTGLTYDLDAARLSGSADPGTGALIAGTASGLRRCVSELRRLLVDLSPPPLPAAGLGPALHMLASGLERRGCQVALDAEEADHLPRPAAALLYRFALEAVRNVSRHSGASAVRITLTRHDDVVTLVVADDGVGFDDARLAERSAEGHLGLRALSDLIGEFGGSLAAASSPGMGTRLTATLPLGPAAPPVGDTSVPAAASS
ncbi:sensor histidine kinase [Blastococcus sp. SYSU DS0510]